MEKSVAIIGGDLRIVNLAKILSEDGWKVFTYGLEKAEGLKHLDTASTLEETITKSEFVISSIPLSQDGITIVAPYAKEAIFLEKLYPLLKGKKFLAGKLPDVLKSHAEIEAYDILEDEEYTILNAIATAEGAIQIAMEEYPKTLNGSKVLVMGFGRIGKILSKMLQGLGAQVFCEARKKEDLAYIQAYGYTPVALENLEENLSQFDILINNIPVLILDAQKLDLLKKEALIIDLASKPGGVDFAYAESKQLKTIWALGLPGKVAPVSVAEYIQKYFYKIMNYKITKERKQK